MVETQTPMELDRLAEQYIKQCGEEHVSKLSIDTKLLREGVVFLKACCEKLEEPPEFIRELDVVVFADEPYQLVFVEGTSGPQRLDAVTLYGESEADDTPMTIDEGLDRVQPIARERRSGNEESVSRMVDDTTIAVGLPEVVETAMAMFDHVASVDVNHTPGHEDPTSIDIQVYTGDVYDYEVVDLYGPEYRVPVTRDGDYDDIQLPFTISATGDGPSGLNLTNRTTVYMTESVGGVKALDVDTGLDYLEEKLARPDEWEPQNSLSLEAIRSHQTE